jgi:hypothetical protein
MNLCHGPATRISMNIRRGYAACTGSMDMKHGHLAWTSSLGHIPWTYCTAWTSRIDMQHGHAAQRHWQGTRTYRLTCSVLHWHADWTSKSNMCYGTATRTSNMIMRCGHTAWIWSMNVQHERTSCTCSMDKQYGHDIAWTYRTETWSCSMYMSTNIFRCSGS